MSGKTLSSPSLNFPIVLNEHATKVARKMNGKVAERRFGFPSCDLGEAVTARVVHKLIRPTGLAPPLELHPSPGPDI